MSQLSRLVDTVSRIFGESSKDKVSIIAANFFGIPEALASWVRQTYLPDKEKGRILKKKSSKESIENDIIEYWKAEMDNPTIKEVFDEWNDRRLALKKISDSTHLRNLQTYNRHFQEFGKTKIKSVKKEDVEDSRHLLSKTYVFTLFFGPR